MSRGRAVSVGFWSAAELTGAGTLLVVDLGRSHGDGGRVHRNTFQTRAQRSWAGSRQQARWPTLTCQSGANRGTHGGQSGRFRAVALGTDRAPGASPSSGTATGNGQEGAVQQTDSAQRSTGSVRCGCSSSPVRSQQMTRRGTLGPAPSSGSRSRPIFRTLPPAGAAGEDHVGLAPRGARRSASGEQFPGATDSACRDYRCTCRMCAGSTWGSRRT